ncbi:carboxypeptidase-like regulatory domain-containing protein [Chitinophaga sp. GCM10012297]|uniref:Carboxypeptidase-like regulatory domain-containing protein n=1 Tax=Chitinophaga chungangae TaxID=2821488 RepID=A0ABS3YDE8_9BACT|nr:carboxypeptidase-like regulatory domain-containing protein [Chitinophaga chungangae]MBO9152711.1 carboxypeptidase-like regulatory domain-containing protein [Chitinophaga chungangae]
MADNQKHIKPTADLIRRYLAGELDDRTMHALEKQALDDPLLADALEGYAMHPPDQSAAVADLRSRFEERLQGGEKAVTAVPTAAPETGKVRRLDYRWAAAAVVLVILTVGGLIMLNREPNPQVAQELQPKTTDTAASVEPGLPDNSETTDTDFSFKKDSAVAPALAAPQAAPAAEEKAAKKLAESEKISLDKEHSEKVNAAYSRELLKAKTAVAPPPPPLAAARKPETFGYAPGAKTVAPLNGDIDTILIGRKRTDTSFMAYNADIARRKALAQGNKVEGVVTGAESKYPRYSEENDIRILSGRVIDAESGERLTGVQIRVQGSRRAAVTDTAGYFAVGIEPNRKVNLDFSHIGYEPANVVVAGNDSNVNVRLAGRNSALSEVVVVRQGNVRKKVLTAAMPYYGDTAYRRYLEGISTVPVKGLKEKQSGEVEISFTVMPNGSLKNFKAHHPFHQEAGKAAIKNVEDGPEWLPASNGKKSTVRLKVPIELVPAQ